MNNDKRHGIGLYNYANGDIYAGMFNYLLLKVNGKWTNSMGMEHMYFRMGKDTKEHLTKVLRAEEVFESCYIKVLILM
jgi:hypothetical protein